ncbi:MAG: ATP-binding cassette domain-containing protein [Bifidobacteriaceae bacterium]|nr:ATP-binding cassette domain-containing protein [Bifidobacteriaceae bacterium]
MSGPVLVLDHVSKSFPLAGRRFAAVDGVSLEVAPGETVGVVGESGCGKTTLAKLVLGLETPDSGRVAVRGARQVVFQDPLSSLDPRFKVGRSVAEPLAAAGARPSRGRRSGWPAPAGAPGRPELPEAPGREGRRERRERVVRALEAVGLEAAATARYPRQFSGGQRQRIAIARALAAEPGLLVLDEPTSALDVSVQARLLNTLLELQERTGVAYLFISHDLAVVAHLAHRIAVMEAGRLVEVGTAEQIMSRPSHPYTRRLMAAQPAIDLDRAADAPIRAAWAAGSSAQPAAHVVPTAGPHTAAQVAPTAGPRSAAHVASPPAAQPAAHVAPTAGARTAAHVAPPPAARPAGHVAPTAEARSPARESAQPTLSPRDKE